MIFRPPLNFSAVHRTLSPIFLRAPCAPRRLHSLISFVSASGCRRFPPPGRKCRNQRYLSIFTLSLYDILLNSGYLRHNASWAARNASVGRHMLRTIHVHIHASHLRYTVDACPSTSSAEMPSSRRAAHSFKKFILSSSDKGQRPQLRPASSSILLLVKTSNRS